MKQLLYSFLFLFVFFFGACTSSENDQDKIQSIDDINQEVVTEIIKANILEEYGGFFRHMRWLNNQVAEGIPCDTTLQLDFTDDSPSLYGLNIPITVTSTCINSPSYFYNQIYEAYHKKGNIEVNTENFRFHIESSDRQSVSVKLPEEKYFYGHHLVRKISFVSGASEDLNVRAHLDALFPNSLYSTKNLDLPNCVKMPFMLKFITNISPVSFEGDIRQIEDDWYIFYKEGDVVKIK